MSRRNRAEGDRDPPGGELVKVAFARDRVEAELIQGLLMNSEIPSLLEQEGLSVDGPQLGFGLATRGFGGGPQRVMVHANRVEQARALLVEARVENEDMTPEIADGEYLEGADSGRARNYGVVGGYARALLWSLGVMGAAFGVFVLLRGF